MDRPLPCLPHIPHLPIYQPGKPIDHVAREFGLRSADIIKLASNENPLGPSPLALQAVRNALEHLHLYPDGHCHALREKLAAHLELHPEQFCFGAGSNEVILFLAQAFIGTGDEAVMGTESFPIYKILTQLCGGLPREVPMPNHRHDLDALLAAVTPRTRVVFLPSPNNPTGTANSAEEIMAFARALPPHLVLLFDEAYNEYLDSPPDLRPLIAEGRLIVCTRTFSKIYGLAGLRLGYGYGPPALIKLLNQVRQPFNTNSLAAIAALAALDDTAFLQRTREVNAQGLRQLQSGLDALRLPYVPSSGNFLLTAVGDAPRAFTWFQSQGVILRPIPSLPGYLRISVGTAEQNARLLRLLGTFLETP